jgi:hypothetical protein
MLHAKEAGKLAVMNDVALYVCWSLFFYYQDICAVIFLLPEGSIF